jgi:Domain of unknown function (DUF1836).
MTINSDDMLNSILDSISRIDYIKSESIPDLDLYMDQIITFMDVQLKSSKRYEDDKILTKTMINNYVKNNLLPPPNKKKYSKEHVVSLIFIYYFKNILPIKDIETILLPLTKKYFQTERTLDLTSLYDEICKMQLSRVSSLKEELKSLYEMAETSFPNADSNDTEQLQLLSFICSLSFDVYVKKLLIEKLIDQIPTSE